MASSTYKLRFKDGRQGTKDTNGNYIDSNGDTLNRSVGVFSYPIAGNPGTLTFPKDSNGTQQTYTLPASIVTLTPNFPTTSCANAAITQSGVITRYASMALPNGRQFVFTYDPNFGEITR